MARDLRTRLAGIRSASRPEERKGHNIEVKSGHRILSGWNLVSPNFWMRKLEQPYFYTEPHQLVDGAPFSARLKDTKLSFLGMRFLDLETTGLSGGTGTVAFLATLGRFSSENNFVTTQYFIDDYPGEPEMIQHLASDLAEAETVVTYNGGSFDLPLFRTRCILNGLRPPTVPQHIDLLVATRRLWRGILPDCSLGTIEREILFINRGPDIPGSAIPELWFSYLRGAKDAELGLSLVFSHNDQDVRTLAWLLSHLTNGFALGKLVKADPVGLAILVGRSNPAQALRILEDALEEGNPRVIKPLMQIYWRAGRRRDRMALVPRLPDDVYGLCMKSLYAEKIDNNLDAALRYAVQGLSCATGSMTIRLKKRLKRLTLIQEAKGGTE